MTTIECLREARALVARGWCQGANARTRTKKRVHPLSRFACAWCTMGAMMKASDVAHSQAPYVFAMRILRRAACIVGETSEWNDLAGRTQEDVLRAFDAAVALTEQEAA